MLAERIGSSQLAELAAQGASLSGSLHAADLPRVHAVLARGAPDGTLAARVDFSGGPESFPVVAIEVQGVLPLVCQRCLGAVAWPVNVAVTLTAVPGEAATQELSDPFDSVLLDSDGTLHLRDAVEDEILATLPLAPLHADRRDCRAGAVAGESAAAAQVHRPFADLGTLLGRGGSRDGH